MSTAAGGKYFERIAEIFSRDMGAKIVTTSSLRKYILVQSTKQSLRLRELFLRASAPKILLQQLIRNQTRCIRHRTHINNLYQRIFNSPCLAVNDCHRTHALHGKGIEKHQRNSRRKSISRSAGILIYFIPHFFFYS